MVAILKCTYHCIYGAPVVEKVDQRIFTYSYRGNCMDCSDCHDICCSYGADIDILNQERLFDLPVAFDRLVPLPKSQWLQRETYKDDEFSGGYFRRTALRDGRCVFLNRKERGCLIHSFCLENGLDHHNPKPMVCNLFPVTFQEKILQPSSEIIDKNLFCRDRGVTLYQGSRNDLGSYFGPGLVAELDGLEQIVRKTNQSIMVQIEPKFLQFSSARNDVTH